MRQIVKKMLRQYGYDLKRIKDPPEVIFEIEADFNELYAEAQRKCQMEGTDNLLRRQRHYVLQNLVRQSPLDRGDVCELGCWRGLSAYQIARTMVKAGKLTTFHLFDSFEGLSCYQREDITPGVDQDLEQRRKQFACSLDIVKDNLKEFGFIRFYKGWVPQRFPEVADKKFSLVHIDLDLYQPIADSIRFFYPRLVQGGVMVFDDYGYVLFPGAKKAIDEYLQEHREHFFLPLPSGQAFLVKA